MAIADRIAAVQADITEYQAVLTKVADQQNQLDTAALQHGNDQQALKDLKVKFDADELEIVDLQGQLGAKIDSSIPCNRRSLNCNPPSPTQT
jgi:endonuclease/exonuclease/phosphatase family metal-dependent hydrolase